MHRGSLGNCMVAGNVRHRCLTAEQKHLLGHGSNRLVQVCTGLYLDTCSRSGQAMLPQRSP